ncbi:MAG: EamA family transporter, partial [Actinomycetota bacterium]
GIVFALTSAVTIAFFLIGLQTLVRRTSPLASSMWVALWASAGMTAFALITGTRFPSWPDEWVPVLAMGVLTAGAFSFLFLGVRRLGAVRASIIASLEPVAAALLALWFLGELVRPGVLLGGLLILGGAVAASLARGVPEPEAGP